MEISPSPNVLLFDVFARPGAPIVAAPVTYRSVSTSVRGQLEVEEVVHEFLHLVDVPQNASPHGVIAGGDRFVVLTRVSVLQVTLPALPVDDD